MDTNTTTNTQYYKNTRNIAKVRIHVFKKKPSQLAVRPHADEDEQLDDTHGDALVGSIERRVYFDLGGHYNLIDDTAYDQICDAIDSGKLKHAHRLTPQDMGHTEIGVSMDLAAASTTGATSI